MRTLSDKLARLTRRRTSKAKPMHSRNRLSTLTNFGPNPGALKAAYYLPKSLAKKPALVVVLHGCTQIPADYDTGSGWSKLADEHGFALLYPQQLRDNNGNLCFNWFLRDDISRGGGEALSIRQMIETMCSRHRIADDRIFVTGLSAGGAMANVMLATYPEVFAGGAIIAGLPYATAATVSEAFDRMRGHGIPEARELRAGLRAASSHTGPWPTLSVWHGTNDSTVSEANARAIIEQWRGVHDLGSTPAVTETVDGQARKVWKGVDGRDRIALYSIRDMGHGLPLDAASSYGKTGPYMLDVGISSTAHIAHSWGLTRKPARGRRNKPVAMPTSERVAPADRPSTLGEKIRTIIGYALRTTRLKL
ncbi:extracellular catalytic domain type 1 short-chain-length polyhydroxyalkanoate depolymerase [Sinorhizobium fredii]|uniref:extracellular catalytic domain type 1 short-chain-length polyhydroxyalkanoate depolymerase n=1 Tax=Rhizobium fredii TaxID=380 RepID=UPI001294C961|nr:PHB depolymerase family esterase [Sinorhizobium fredii]MQW98706.1 PHB depolymerase family esterase [Sinorhizobium fredii]UTY46838.1 PHB depolymerase family esterase [Sinorhizobium fredii]